MASLPALAAPEGEDVVAGDVAVERTHTRLGPLTSVTASDGAIINWDSFNIGVNETVEFIQPGDWSRVLNRVLSADPTVISGRITAPGHVYIAAPSGIYFQGTAIVDVGRLVAIGGNISNENFLAGNDRFELTAPVENTGTLEADAVSLLGTRVANHHSIVARDGLIIMAAGDSVWISEHGSNILIELKGPGSQESDSLLGAAGPALPDGPAVENTGTLDAGKGSVRLAAGDMLSIALRSSSVVRGRDIVVAGGNESRVDVRGVLDASDVAEDGLGGVGGTIDVTGDWIAVRDATLDASGDAGGGRIRVGGERHGKGTLRRARALVVDEDVVMRADATAKGDGGEIVQWSDELTHAHGRSSARGGAQGGDGGLIETSSKGHLSTGEHTPDASAPQGKAGDWLLDPADLRIVSDPPPGDVSTAPFANLNDAFDRFDTAITLNPIVFPVVEQSFVSAGRIATALAGGTNVTLTTELFDGLGADQGNITFEESIDFTGLDANPGTITSLTLDAANDIRFAPGVSIDATTEADGDLQLNIDFNANGEGRLSGIKQPELSGQQGYGLISLPATSAIRTNGGGVALRGGAPSADDAETAGLNIQGEVTTGGGDFILQSIGGDVVIGDAGANNISTGGGAVAIDAVAREVDEQTVGGGVTVHGTLVTEGGNVDIRGVDNDVDTDGIDTRRTDGSGAPGGSIAVDVASDLLNGENDTRRTITINGDLQSGGSLVEVGGTQLIAGFLLGPGEMAINGNIESEGGDVALGSSAFGSNLTLTGGVATGGGTFQVRGARAEIQAAASPPMGGFTINAENAARDAAGNVDIRVNDEVVIGDGVTIGAETLVVSAALDGNIDADMGNNAQALRIGDNVQLAADQIQLLAGDGYTAELITPLEPGEATRTEAAISFGNMVSVTDRASAGVAGDGPVLFSVIQDASLSDASIPQITDAAAPAMGEPAVVQELFYESSDGTVTVTQDVSSDIEQLTLRSGAGGADQRFDIQGNLTPGQLLLETYEDYRVDMAANLAPTNELEIRSGLASSAATASVQAIPGDLIIATDLGASDRISLRSGVAGVGDLTFDAAAAPVLSSVAVDLRAGDGAVGPATAKVDVTNANFAGVSELSVRQDASIDGIATTVPDAFNPDPATGSFSQLARLDLRSDDGSVRIDSDLEAQTLALRSRSGLNFEPGVELRANSYEIGGSQSFDVSSALLDVLKGLANPLGPTELTFSSGDGNLSLSAPGIGADSLTLISGLESNNQTSYTIDGLSSTELTNTAGTAAPDRFTFVQKAQITDSTLESFNFFGDGMAPSLVRVRSDAPTLTPILLSRLAELLQDGGTTPGALANVTQLTLEGSEVSLSKRDASDLDFVNGSDTKIFVRANRASFNATNDTVVECGAGGPACTSVVLRPDGSGGTGEVRVGGFEPVFDPEIAVEDAFDPDPMVRDAFEASLEQPLIELAVVQDADLGLTAIPSIVGDKQGTLLSLQSARNDIDLRGVPGVTETAAELLEGTRLTLSLSRTNAEDADPDDVNNPRRIFFQDALQLDSLTVNAEGGLLFENATIDVTPVDPLEELDTNDFIVIRVGTSGLGDLTIAENVTLTAQGMEFTSGSGLDEDSKVVFAGAGPTLNFEDDPTGDSVLVVQQDADIVHDPMASDPLARVRNLPDNTRVSGSTADDRPAVFNITSRQGDVIIREVADLSGGNTQVSANFADGTITLEDETGDLDLTANNEVLSLTAPTIAFVAAGQVIAEADDMMGGTTSPLALNGLTDFSITQGSPIDANALPSITRFTFSDTERLAGANGRLLGINYRLESTTGEVIDLDTELAQRVAGSELTLATSERVRISTPADLTSLTVAPGTPAATMMDPDPEPVAPVTEFALSGPNPEDTRLEVLGDLRFDGDVELGPQTPTLVGRDVTIGGDVSGARTVGLEIEARRNVVFGGDIGSDGARIAHLDVRLDEAAGQGPNVLFDAGTDAGRSIDAVDYVHIRSNVDEGGTAGGRSIASSVATIASSGDLDIEVEAQAAAPDGSGFAINFGPTAGLAGGAEKLTVAGTARLKAGCGAGAGADCTGAARVGDVSAMEFIVNADRLDIVRRAAATVITPGGSSSNDAGTDLVANRFVLTRQRGDAVVDPLALSASGGGNSPAFGVPSSAQLEPFMAFLPTATIFPSGRLLEKSDFSDVIGQRDIDGDAGDLTEDIVRFYDLQPGGPSFADLSRAIDERAEPPRAIRPPQPRDRIELSLASVGIEARPATPAEFAATLGGAGIYDDASSSWGESGTERVSASRLDPTSAALAVELHREILGEDYANAEAIRESLGGALRSYLRSTGATKVLGFELRRWLTNRPSSQFDAYRTLQDLDRLFAAHRRSGLARSEYERIQREWLAQIKPEGIALEELAQTVHPTRYVRGSDILDIFGE